MHIQHSSRKIKRRSNLCRRKIKQSQICRRRKFNNRKHRNLQKLTNKVSDTSKKFGLNINVQKTKVMVIESNDTTKMNTQVEGQTLEQVTSFKYVGGIIENTGENDEDIQAKIAKGLQTMGRLKKLWRKNNLSTKCKLQIYKSIIVPQMTYGAETWTIKKQDEKRLLVAEMSCLRQLLGISRIQKIRNTTIREKIGIQENIVEKIRKKRLSWFGHVCRMEKSRWPYKALHTYTEGKRKRGRPRKKWQDNIKEDLEIINSNIIEAGRIAEDRKEWKKFLSSYCRK